MNIMNVSKKKLFCAFTEIYYGFFIGLTNSNGVTCYSAATCSENLQWAESGDLFQSEAWLNNNLHIYVQSSQGCTHVDYEQEIYSNDCTTPRPFLCEISC